MVLTWFLSSFLAGSRHPQHDAIAHVAFQAAGGGRAYAGLYLPPLGGSKELHVKLEQVEADLAAIQKVVADGAETLKLVKGEKGMIHAETNRLMEKGKAMEAKYKGAE